MQPAELLMMLQAPEVAVTTDQRHWTLDDAGGAFMFTSLTALLP